MPAWVLFGSGALVCWGLWGVCAKLADQAGYSPLAVFVISNAVGFLGAVGVFTSMRFHLEPNSKALWWSVAAGLAGTAAIVFFFVALNKGKASVVMPFTAMYPLVTVLLSMLFLKERITWTQGAGIACAFLASVLLTRPD